MAGIHFTIGSGNSRTTFERAPLHTAKWIDQKKGFRTYLGLPEHGKVKA